MKAKTALHQDEMVVLNYDHAKREITTEGGGVCSVDEARQLFDRALVSDCNIAMSRLQLEDFNMDAVEAFYRDADQ